MSHPSIACTQSSGFWGPRVLWKIAYRAARSGIGEPYFEMHPEFSQWLRLARHCVEGSR